MLNSVKFQVVREIHNHHEQKRNELRELHGSLFDDFANIHDQLNHLSVELHQLSDHGVALDANFSKFGYDAHLSWPILDALFCLFSDSS